MKHKEHKETRTRDGAFVASVPKKYLYCRSNWKL